MTRAPSFHLDLTSGAILKVACELGPRGLSLSDAEVDGMPIELQSLNEPDRRLLSRRVAKLEEWALPARNPHEREGWVRDE